jgi:hypothetical protein
MNKNKTNAGTACPDSANEAAPYLNRGNGERENGCYAADKMDKIFYRPKGIYQQCNISIKR